MPPAPDYSLERACAPSCALFASSLSDLATPILDQLRHRLRRGGAFPAQRVVMAPQPRRTTPKLGAIAGDLIGSVFEGNGPKSIDPRATAEGHAIISLADAYVLMPAEEAGRVILRGARSRSRWFPFHPIGLPSCLPTASVAHVFRANRRPAVSPEAIFDWMSWLTPRPSSLTSNFISPGERRSFTTAVELPEWR